jgi:hypothetical protein
MGYQRRDPKHLSLAARLGDEFIVLDESAGHFPLKLIEKLRAGVDVKIPPILGGCSIEESNYELAIPKLFEVQKRLITGRGIAATDPLCYVDGIHRS